MVKYHDKEVQVTSDIPKNDYEAMDNVLESIKSFPGKVSLGDFLQWLFTKPGEADISRAVVLNLTNDQVNIMALTVVFLKVEWTLEADGLNNCILLPARLQHHSKANENNPFR